MKYFIKYRLKLKYNYLFSEIDEVQKKEVIVSFNTEKKTLIELREGIIDDHLNDLPIRYRIDDMERDDSIENVQSFIFDQDCEFETLMFNKL